MEKENSCFLNPQSLGLTEIEINTKAKVIAISQFPGAIREELRKKTLQRITDEKVFINIAGTSGAGKTTAAQHLYNALKTENDVSCFDMDWYLAGDLKKRISHVSPDPAKPYLCGINPLCFNLPEVAVDLNRLKNGEEIEVPLYDRTKHERQGKKTYKAGKIIIVEGIHAFDEDIAFPASICCLVVADFHSRLIRKCLRTLRVYQRGPFEDIVREYIDSLEPGYQYHIGSLIERADFIVDNSGLTDINIQEIDRTQVRTDLQEIGRLLSNKGNTQEKEVIRICQDKEGQYYFQYSYDGKVLLNEEISRETLLRLMTHYRLTGVS